MFCAIGKCGRQRARDNVPKLGIQAGGEFAPQSLAKFKTGEENLGPSGVRRLCYRLLDPIRQCLN